MNGASASNSESQADPEQLLETTPLLSSHDDLPYVDPEVARLQAAPNIREALQSRTRLVETTVDYAFDIIVLLRLKTVVGTQRRSGHILDQLSSELDDDRNLAVIDSALSTTWHCLDNIASSKEMEEFLLTAFTLNEMDTKMICVIDVLGHKDFPQDLLRHHILEIGLLRIWKQGHTVGEAKSRFGAWILRLSNKLCTPRVVHVLDLILFLIYFGSLVHYSVVPPTAPTETAQVPSPTLREAFILVFAFAQLCRPWQITVAPFILTLLSFLSSLPSIPCAQDGAYSVLLLAVSLHLLQLHLPRSPSPLLLLPFDLALPLATLVQHGIFKIFIPVILFFLPALLLALFLLSTSLSDILLHLTIAAVNPSPLEARTAFLTLLAIVFILLLCSLVMLILVYPHLSSEGPPPSQWDRYSRAVGSDARRAMVSIVARYSQPTYFPTPLNLIQFIFVWVPTWTFRWMGRKNWQLWVVNLEGVLWFSIVGPLIMLASGFYLWGYISVELE